MNDTYYILRSNYLYQTLYRGEEDENLNVQDFDERDIETVNLNNKSRAGSARKRKDSYDYINTVQMLGMFSHDRYG